MTSADDWRPPSRDSLFPAPHHAGGWEQPPAPEPRRRAVWPWIAGFVVFVVSAGVVFGLQTQGAATELPDPLPAAGAGVDARAVEPGTCLKELPEGDGAGTVSAVPCDVEHQAEAVATYTLGSDTWPGDGSVRDTVLGYCGQFIQPGFGDSPMFTADQWDQGLRWVAWLPTESDWADGYRDGTCVAYVETGTMRGSLVARTAELTP